MGCTHWSLDWQLQQKTKSVPKLLSCAQACWWTVASWCTYPIVYILPMLMSTTNGQMSAGNVVGIQVGYSIADVISKCGVGLLVYSIGMRKSLHLEKSGPMSGGVDGFD